MAVCVDQAESHISARRAAVASACPMRSYVWWRSASQTSFSPIEWVSCAYKRLTTWLHAEKVRHFLSTPCSDVKLRTIPTGMSLQSWLKTTWLCLVGFGLFTLGFLGRKPPKANQLFSLAPYSYGMAVDKYYENTYCELLRPFGQILSDLTGLSRIEVQALKKPQTPVLKGFTALYNGCSGWDRTSDQVINSHLLYRWATEQKVSFLECLVGASIKLKSA